MPPDLIPLWLAALPLMGSPGPATLSLAAVGAQHGFARGTGYLAGIIAGTTGVLAMIAFGVTGLLFAVPALATAISLAAAAYILYLAWRIATARPLGDPGDNPPPAFAGGLFLALANPKAFAAIGAVYAAHTLAPGDLVRDSLLKGAALFLVIVAVNVTWLAAGAALSRLLRAPRTARAINLAFAGLLLLSVVLALV